MGKFRPTAPDLAGVRKRRGISLQDIARTTRIGVSYLQAIEDGRIEKLPGEVYTKSYIRQYARAIDYDEHDLLEQCGITREEETSLAEESQPSGLQGHFRRFMGLVYHVYGTTVGPRRMD
jgi:cytoskeletal protein RodZ